MSLTPKYKLLSSGLSAAHVRITFTVTLPRIASIWTIEMQSGGSASPSSQIQKTEIEVETYPGDPYKTATHREETLLPTTKRIVEEAVRDHLERHGLSRLRGGLDNIAPGHSEAALDRLKDLFPEFELGASERQGQADRSSG